MEKADLSTSISEVLGTTGKLSIQDVQMEPGVPGELRVNNVNVPKDLKSGMNDMLWGKGWQVQCTVLDGIKSVGRDPLGFKMVQFVKGDGGVVLKRVVTCETRNLRSEEAETGVNVVWVDEPRDLMFDVGQTRKGSKVVKSDSGQMVCEMSIFVKSASDEDLKQMAGLMQGPAVRFGGGADIKGGSISGGSADGGVSFGKGSRINLGGGSISGRDNKITRG